MVTRRVLGIQLPINKSTHVHIMTRGFIRIILYKLSNKYNILNYGRLKSINEDDSYDIEVESLSVNDNNKLMESLRSYGYDVDNDTKKMRDIIKKCLKRHQPNVVITFKTVEEGDSFKQLMSKQGLGDYYEHLVLTDESDYENGELVQSIDVNETR